MARSIGASLFVRKLLIDEQSAMNSWQPSRLAARNQRESWLWRWGSVLYGGATGFVLVTWQGSA